MGLLGVADSELAHSRIVEWLLTPTGRHGLGDRVLQALLFAGWPGFPIPDTGSAIVRREVERRDEEATSRADVVAWMGSTILVVENKVWADEAIEQCEILHRHWRGEASDVRWLLLSLEGRLPRSATTPEATAAWRGISYRQLAGLLQRLVPANVTASAGPGAVVQYLATLRNLVGPTRSFAVTLPVEG